METNIKTTKFKPLGFPGDFSRTSHTFTLRDHYCCPLGSRSQTYLHCRWQTAGNSALVKVRKCKCRTEGGGGEGSRDRDVVREPWQRDTELLIGEGQTEGKAVSSWLISTDRLSAKAPPGCPALCCVLSAAPAGQQRRMALLMDGECCG